jgi:ABC-type transport system substrate-binding protein
MTRALRLALAAASVTLLISCVGGQEAGNPPEKSTLSSTASAASPSVQPVTDYSSFAQALESAGFTVRDGERSETDMLFTEDRQAVLIDGVSVSTYEYPTSKALDEARSSISRDGYSVQTSTADGNTVVEWVATPHFYSAGTLLVLYVGDEQRTLDALERLLGPPFAGG